MLLCQHGELSLVSSSKLLQDLTQSLVREMQRKCLWNFVACNTLMMVYLLFTFGYLDRLNPSHYASTHSLVCYV